MTHSDTNSQFFDSYRTYADQILRPTRLEVRNILKRWDDPTFWFDRDQPSRLPAPSPIQRAYTRIKRPESVVDKISRKTESYPHGLHPDSFRNMHDTLGVRIVAYFVTSLAIVDRTIRRSPLFELSDSRPPVAYIGEGAGQAIALRDTTIVVKPSGYISIHYVVRLKTSEVRAQDRPWFEIQLRTMVEDVWAEIEHVLGYKPEKRTSFAVRKQFRLLSRQLQLIDEHFNFLAEELVRYQEEISYDDTDPLNAENLAGVLAESQIGCSQREIDGMLKLLNSRNISSIGDLRSLCTSDAIDLIVRVYKSQEHRRPFHFELVANLAVIAGLSDRQERSEAIKEQIAFLNAWDALRTILGD